MWFPARRRNTVQVSHLDTSLKKPKIPGSGLGPWVALAVVKLAGYNSPWAKCYENASIMQSCDCLAVDLQNIIGWTQDKLMSMSQLGKCISSMSTCFLCRMLFRESDFATRLRLLLFQLHHLAQRLSLLCFWEASAPWPWMAASATSFFIRQFSMTAFSIFFEQGTSYVLSILWTLYAKCPLVFEQAK